MQHFTLIAFCNSILLSASIAESLPWEVRAWKNSEGKEIKATLVNWEASKVKLRNPTGVESEVPVNFLSVEDQKFLAGEKDRLTKILNDKLAGAAGKPATGTPPAGANAAKAATPPPGNKSILSISSQQASQAYRLGVPVPGPGGGVVAKVSGKVESIVIFKKNNLEQMVIELEGGVALEAGTHESIFGGSKMKLKLEKGSVIQYPTPPPATDATAPKAATPLPPVRLFGVGDTVTLNGQVYFVPDKAGTKANYFARGVNSFVGVNKPVVFAEPKPVKTPPKVDPKKDPKKDAKKDPKKDAKKNVKK